MSAHHAALDRPRWAHVRRQVLDTAGWRCAACERSGRLEVHHIEPLAAGGDPYDADNLQALCRGCHIAKHRRPRTPAEQAWSALVADIERGHPLLPS